MEQREVYLGLDLGNNDVKTARITIPNGYDSYKKAPFGISNYMIYEGNYYITSNERSNYLQDKTTSDMCKIMSMIGIAEELIVRVKEQHKESLSDKSIIQNEISKITKIKLGVGLPPLDFPTFAQKTKDYYLENFKDTSYEYSGIKFHYEVTVCKIYAQGLNAALTYKKNDGPTIPEKFNDSEYYIIDIGGYTVDVITIENGIPLPKKCFLISKGIIPMKDNIISKIQKDFGKEITRQNVESVLRKKNNILSDEIIETINHESSEWAESIINECTQKGLRFDTVPTVLLGGGSLLLKEQIVNAGLINTFEFIPDPRVNAIGYEKAIKQSNSN